MNQAMKNRPAGEPGGLQKRTIISTPILPRFTPEDAVSRAEGMYLLMVYSPESGGYRRKIYLSLKAAERAARRARERGHIAHVILGTFAVQEVVR